MKILINQFAMLGDILFSIPIAKKYIDDGHEVIWYINDEFMNLQEHFPYINFISKNQNTEYDLESDKPYETDTLKYIPLRFANNLLSNGNPMTCMSDKYKFVNMSLSLWKTLTWESDKEKEDKLYYDVLGLVDGEKYNFIVDTFSSKHKINININNDNRDIVLNKLDGYSMLDWGKVILNATTIHTVGTSINYMIEVIDTIAEEYHLYARKPYESHCNFYNYLFEKPYIEHI